MNTTTKFHPLTDPFSPKEKGDSVKGPAPMNNMYGFNSIQDFSGVFGNHNSDLSQTHADALGFHAYMANFYTKNFWFKDGGVQTWQYEEPYDHWQNIYGVDAVCVFYHSGHGNMDANGVFQAPVGSSWNGETWFLSNHNVKFGNQVSRYIFWSTCLSCRYSGGKSPIKTWWADDNNPGFRMLFGYETTSVDNPNYGSNFWNHWRNGESFSSAFLNASWDIYHNQSPCCVASGSDATDAINRLNNERFFYWGAVARNYYQWKWYYASTKAVRNQKLPKELKVAEFFPSTFESDHVHTLAGKFGITSSLSLDKDGHYSIGTPDKSVSLNKQGHLNLKLADTNHTNTKQLDEKKAYTIAEQHIQELNLHAGETYAFDVLRITSTAGGSPRDKKETNPHVIETTVQYRQIINGIPSVNSDAGLIRVTIDNDGTVTRLHSSVKKVASLSSNPKSMAINPSEKTGIDAVSAQAIEDAFSSQLKNYKNAKFLEEETGYDVADTHGKIVTQRVYEVTFEHNLKKLVKLTVSRFE